MNQLLSNEIDFDQNVFRNVPEIADPFSDIIDSPEDTALIDGFCHGQLHVYSQKQHFHAIGYSFANDNITNSRFSDGSFAAWYGALDTQTTIIETIFHIVRDNLAIIDFPLDTKLSCERVIYELPVQGILVDLREVAVPEDFLSFYEYHYWQKIGAFLHDEGKPGALYSSARAEEGTCVVAFQNNILGEIANSIGITYQVDFSKKKAAIMFSGRNSNSTTEKPLFMDIACWF